MKASLYAALAVSALHGATARTVAFSFGPQNCVSIARSTVGSCVMTTNCEGQDLSKVDFAFDCVGTAAGIVRHSFGVGGFDSNEEFDTDVKCAKCEAVSAEDVVVKPVTKKVAVDLSKPKPVKKVVTKAVAPIARAAVQHRTVRAATKAKAKFWPFVGGAKKAPEAVKYGPNGCVSTWRSKEGHCIMKTDCKKSDISKYEFGLVCVDKVGSPVRHLFGKDSFDEEETFDTLIKCDKCLGLEDIPDAVALNGEVMTMSRDIANLKAVMQNISINVQMLNSEVFKAASPGPAPAAAAGGAPAPASLIHHATSHQRKQNLRQAKKDDDDDDDDDRDDADDED